MPIVLVPPQVAISKQTGETIRGGTGKVYADTDYNLTIELTCYTDATGGTTTQPKSSSEAIIPEFWVNLPVTAAGVFWVAGGVRVWLASRETYRGRPGSDGANGKTAYQYAVEGGYQGSEADFSAEQREVGEAATNAAVSAAEAQSAREAAEAALGRVDAPTDTVVSDLVGRSTSSTQASLNARYATKEVATSAAAGLMAAADKALLDAATSGNVYDTLVRRNSTGRVVLRQADIVDAPTAPQHMAHKGYVDNAATTAANLIQVLPNPGGDLNTYTATGRYRQALSAAAASGSNYPAPVAGLLTVASDNPNMVFQTYQTLGLSSANRLYWRANYNSTWQPWQEVADTATTVRKGELSVSVLDYGAKGDGNTDDTAAINAAITAAATAGKVVVFPAATFKISSWLRAKAGTVLDARGATINLHIASGVSEQGLLTNGASTDKFYGYAGNGGISIIGGTWNARGHLNTASFSNGFALGHATGITVTESKIMNIARGHAMDIAGSKDVRVINCGISGYTDNGSPRGTEAIQLDITSADGFPHFGASDNTPCRNVVISGCTFTESADCGAWPRAIGSHGADATKPMVDITVTGCSGTVTDIAIRALNWIDFSVTGNTFRGGGIHILSIDNSTSANIVRGSVSGNVLREVGHVGIWLAGRAAGKIMRCSIASNIVEQSPGSGRHAISLEHAEHNTVTSNVIINADRHGINLDAAVGNTVTQNKIDKTKSHGINVNNSHRNNVLGNNINEAGEHGVSCSGFGDDNRIDNNTVTDCSRVVAGSVGIRVNGMTRTNVTLNMVRSSDTKPNNGVSIASGAADSYVFGNDLRGSAPTPYANSGSRTIEAQNLV